MNNNNNNIALVIFSADINNDLWVVNDILINKYWPSHPSIYLLSETKQYKNFNTINFNYPLSLWTKRIRESLALIPEKYIIFMCDDCFLQEPVNEKLLNKCLCFMQEKSDIANINFEISFDNRDLDCENPYLKFRPNGALTKVSLLCGLWNKDKLISLLRKDCNLWEIEKEQNNKDYDYYILKDKKVISWLNDGPFLCGGIFQGKYHHNTLEFLQNEGIDISKLHGRKEVD